jgi:hypothetical protein
MALSASGPLLLPLKGHSPWQDSNIAGFATPRQSVRLSSVVSRTRGTEVSVLQSHGQDNWDAEEVEGKNPPAGSCINRKRLRDPTHDRPHRGPLLPDILDLSATSPRSNGVYRRHIPLYSPIGGVSWLDLDFVSKLERSTCSSRSPADARSWGGEMISSITTLIVNSFPTLEDDDSTVTRWIGPHPAATRALKMRRQCKYEFAL